MLPPLHTPRLLLRPAAPEDLDPLWQLWTHPLVRRYLWDDRTIDRDEAASTLRAVIDLAEFHPQMMGLWIIEPRTPPPRSDDPVATVATDAASDTHPPLLGCAAFTPVSTAADYEPALTGLSEPLVALHPDHWHKGYAHEALMAVLTHAFGTLELETVAAVTDVPNEASDRMLRRAGFQQFSEGDGPRYRMRNYRLERTTWLASTAAGTPPARP